MSIETSGPAGQQSGDGAQQKAQDVAGHAQEKAHEATTEAKSKVREQVDQRSTAIGQQASTTAEDLRGVAEHLRSQGKDQPARAVEKAAQRAEGIGSYLQRSDGERILHDAEDFGRQRPWAVVAGGLVVGFAASRLLRASSGRRYGSRPGSEAAVPSVNRVAESEPVRMPGAAPLPAPANPPAGV